MFIFVGFRLPRGVIFGRYPQHARVEGMMFAALLLYCLVRFKTLT